mgnify:CR=1 FL=1
MNCYRCKAVLQEGEGFWNEGGPCYGKCGACARHILNNLPPPKPPEPPKLSGTVVTTTDGPFDQFDYYRGELLIQKSHVCGPHEYQFTLTGLLTMKPPAPTNPAPTPSTHNRCTNLAEDVSGGTPKA